jgi:hypothetical protein
MKLTILLGLTCLLYSSCKPKTEQTKEGSKNEIMVSTESETTDSIIPNIVDFGATVEEMKTKLEAICTEVKAREIDPPFIVLRKHVKKEQIQIDCEGFIYFGKPRHAEFIFADNSLEMVWILTTEEDENALMEEMTSLFGNPTHKNELFTASSKGNVAIRTDFPEVLLYSKKITRDILPWFDTKSTFN